MTREEASKDYSFIIKCLNKRRMTPCGFCNSDKCTPVLSDCTADDFVINTAIAALEKQIPKKIVSGKCPCCNCEVWADGNYCDVCGQHLDWGEIRG